MLHAAMQIPGFPRGPIRVAVSECLTGEPVRFDGGHKRSELPHEKLAEYFSYLPVCPEVGIGLGVPRDPIRLVGDVSNPRAVNVEDPEVDVTRRLRDYADSQMAVLKGIDGCIFMKSSPSCGLFSVKVFDGDGGFSARGRGVFAARICAEMPNLPVEEAGRLQDGSQRENFVTRVFVHAHWRAFCRAEITVPGLMKFHSAYEQLVTQRSGTCCKQLASLISDLSGDANGHANSHANVAAEAYFRLLMQTLAGNSRDNEADGYDSP